MPAEERVLCFARSLFEKLGVFQGLSLDTDKYLPVFTESANIFYQNRSAAELDKTSKQLIPYALILCGNKILRYRRGKAGGETRLHGLYSVGVGGHIAEEDSGLFTRGVGYHESMRRELQEEIALTEVNDSLVAVINDDSTEVGWVHLGVVHIVRVESEDVAKGRSGIVAPEFIPVAEAMKDLDPYESWSKFCLEKLDLLLSKAADAGLKPA